MTQIMNRIQLKIIGEQIIKHVFRYRRLLSDAEQHQTNLSKRTS